MLSVGSPTGDGGLTVGVTPHDPPVFPHCSDHLDVAWLVGFDGQAMVTHEPNKNVPLHWSPENLISGDRVGVMVDPDDNSATGTMLIYVNGTLVAEGPSGIPNRAPLYGIVDLAGNAIACSMDLEAPLPGGTLLPVRFERCGQNVRLSPDGKAVARTTAPDKNHLWAISRLPISKEPCEFTIIVTEVMKSRQAEGLAVGVTATRPELMRTTPKDITEIPSLWAVGFDGKQVTKLSGGEAKFRDLKPKWNPHDLQRGDEVRITIEKGQMKLHLSKPNRVIEGPDGIPMDEELYAVVDLLGSAEAVTVSDTVLPPEGGGKHGKKAHSRKSSSSSSSKSSKSKKSKKSKSSRSSRSNSSSRKK